MRLWKKLILGCLLLVLALVAGAVLYVSQVDPNEYRGAIADLVEDYTGRKLQIGGDLKIKLLPVPSVEANDVTFANAPWSSGPAMVRAKRARAEFAVLPILKGRWVVHRVVAIEPQVFLEVDPEGEPNWTFDDGVETAPTVDRETDIGKPVTGLDILIREVRIESGTLDYVDEQVGTRIRVGLDELTLGSNSPGGRLDLSVRAAYQGLPVTLGGRLGAAGAIMRNQPVEVDLEGRVGEVEFTVQGAVGKPLEARSLRLDVALNGKSTKAITDAAGVEVEELGPVNLNARLLEEDGYFHLESVSASARVRQTDASISGSVKNFDFDLVAWSPAETPQQTPMNVDLEGKFGEASIRVDGDVGDPLEGKDVRLGVALEAPATRPLTELAGVDFEEVGPVALTFTVRDKAGRFDFRDIDLRARPRETDATMKGSLSDLVMAFDGEKKQGKPAKVDVKGSFGESKYSVAGDVGKPMEAKDLHLKVTLRAKVTKPLTELAGVDLEELGPVNLNLTVTEKDGRFDLDGMDITARPRDADVSVKGSVADVAENPQPDVEVTLSAKTLRQLDETLPDVGPVSMSAKVRPSGDVVEVRDLVASVGKSDLSGSATVDTGAQPPSARARLRARVIDLTEFLPPREESSSPDDGDKAESETGPTRDRTSTAATGQPTGKRVFSDAPLPFDVLKKANGDVELAVDRLVTRTLVLEKVAVTAKLDDGNLTLEPTVHIAGGTLGGTVNIDARTQPTKVAADLGAKQVSIGTLTKEIRGYETSRGLDSSLDLKLSGRGESVRDLMAGLDGNVRLEVGEGRLKNDVLDRVGADLFSQIIGIAVPEDEKDGTTALNCGVLRFTVSDGEAIADQTIVLETEKVLVKGGGLIDLKSEKLDLGAKLAARKGIGIGTGTLSSLAKLQGTLAEPVLGTDLTEVVKAGAKVGIAFVTVGLSLVAEGVYGQISEDEHPCQTALARQMKVSPKEYKEQKAAEEN